MNRRYPLHIHITTLFLVLILVVGGLLAGIGYKLTRDMLESAADDLSMRISAETLRELGSAIAPAELAVNIMTYGPINLATTLRSRLERLDRRFLSPLFLTPGSEPASQHRIHPAGDIDAAHAVAAPQDAGPAGSSGGGGGIQQGGGAGGEGAHDASSGCAGGMALP